MQLLLRVSAGIDRFSNIVGRAVSWLVLLMVLVSAYNAVVRYLGRFIGLNLSSNAYIEAQWYMFSLVFLLGAGWALKEDAHVRVDVLYGRLSGRARAWIDLLGGVLLLIPFCLFVVWSSLPSVLASWSVREGSPDPGGLPRYPIKAMILVSLALLLIQGVSEIIKSMNAVRTASGAEHSPEPQVEGIDAG